MKEKDETGDSEESRIDKTWSIEITQSDNTLEGARSLDAIDDKIETDRPATIRKTQAIREGFHQIYSHTTPLTFWNFAILLKVETATFVRDSKKDTTLTQVACDGHTLGNIIAIAVNNSIFYRLKQGHRDSRGIIIDVASVANGTYKAFDLD